MVVVWERAGRQTCSLTLSVSSCRLVAPRVFKSIIINQPVPFFFLLPLPFPRLSRPSSPRRQFPQPHWITTPRLASTRPIDSTIDATRRQRRAATDKGCARPPIRVSPVSPAFAESGVLPFEHTITKPREICTCTSFSNPLPTNTPDYLYSPVPPSPPPPSRYRRRHYPNPSRRPLPYHYLDPRSPPPPLSPLSLPSSPISGARSDTRYHELPSRFFQPGTRQIVVGPASSPRLTITSSLVFPRLPENAPTATPAR